MDEKVIQDLAVAFVKIKLQEYQNEQHEKLNTSSYAESNDDEIRYCAKMYKYFIENFELELNSID